MKFSKVLVPLDGSAVAEAILPFIEQIAGPLDMEVSLVHIVPLTPADVPVLREMDPQGYLELVVEKLRAKGIRARGWVRFGSPAAEIIAVAKEIAADLIAMTTHGRAGLGRLLFGSVAETVLRASPIPVFLMRMTEAALERAPAEVKSA